MVRNTIQDRCFRRCKGGIADGGARRVSDTAWRPKRVSNTGCANLNALRLVLAPELCEMPAARHDLVQGLDGHPREAVDVQRGEVPAVERPQDVGVPRPAPGSLGPCPRPEDHPGACIYIYSVCIIHTISIAK